MANEEAPLLHRTQLGTTEAAAALGISAIQGLVLYGAVTLYLDKQGYVNVAPPGEVTLDALPEPMALQELIRRGYDDARLEDYLKGRDARMGRG